MPLNRTEAGTVFNTMIAAVRQSQGQAEIYELASRFWARDGRWGSRGARAAYQDYVAVAARAIAAYQAAEMLRQRRDSPHARLGTHVLVSDIPRQRGIYASQPEYEYRVVVTGLEPGRYDRAESVVIVRSNTLLDAEEVESRALRMVQRSTLNPSASNRTLRAATGATQTARLVGVSRYEP